MIHDILSGKTEKHLTTFNNFLIEPTALESFLKLQMDAKKDGFDLQIISAYRSFEAQLKIWNAKTLGQRKLYSNDGKDILDFETLTKEEIVFAILRWSALPGASRHHWGTDIDVFDQNKLEPSKVELTIAENEPGGVFYELHQWLDQKIDTGSSYGFYRPYNEDLGGVSPEKWHLSFKPISSQYYQKYTYEFIEDLIQQSEINLKSYILKNLHIIYKDYITNINT